MTLFKIVNSVRLVAEHHFDLALLHSIDPLVLRLNLLRFRLLHRGNNILGLVHPTSIVEQLL